MAMLRFTILGCGSSGGVPRIGGHWGACDPENPKNTRRRCSLLIEQEGPGGWTRVLIDTSPDMRMQLIDAGVGELDGVVFTHAHADHVHGIDDLRQVVFNMDARVPVWADAHTAKELEHRFHYVFTTPEGSPYPPILEMRRIEGAVTVTGKGGPVTLLPFRVNHGSIDALGFRIRDLAYLPDVLKLSDEAWEVCAGLDCWILDCLRRKPHPSHSHLAQSLAWIERAAPERAVLTNLHIDLDYAELDAETPDHIVPAYDGMQITYEI
ncbi:MBL fold metallo-hydrolase [Pseudooceanicola sp. CBS1P-1]|uniref:MBL fold metallo-hydrolase n=1 Tax=Pseudooceanicola albus TaxID=2692189 RepID=A0A6L7G995_9RHOB|nr:MULTISPECIES: MBL fold metallo-hydrolase [Pseudooceanicola]MBT9382909.1 MBL fold metallo-hydrolase [Pseudooceanicola endophyticus]MXN20167.1 MBL fold metallo-hydrolase [Pseudooceanicola albus]